MNRWYPKGKQALCDASLNWTSDTIKAAQVGTAYTFNAAHQFRSDLSAVVGTDGALASKTNTDGVLDAADLTLAAIAAGSTVDALVLYKDTGVAATSPLIAYLDTGPGVPYTTDGLSKTVQWDNGPNKILAIQDSC